MVVDIVVLPGPVGCESRLRGEFGSALGAYWHRAFRRRGRDATTREATQDTLSPLTRLGELLLGDQLNQLPPSFGTGLQICHERGSVMAR